MIDHVQRAVELAGNCRFTWLPSADDWDSLPQVLSECIPEGHRRLVNHFGSGHFGSDLYLLCPHGSDNIKLDAGTHDRFLIEYGPMLREIREDLWKEIFPSPGGMVLVAENTSRIAIFLDARERTVVLDLGCPARFDFKVDFAEFICRLHGRNYARGWDADWVDEFRTSLWPNPSKPFFTPTRKVAPRQAR